MPETRGRKMKEWIDKHFDMHVELLKTLAAVLSPSYYEEKRDPTLCHRRKE